jgi:hypothetical protein
LLPVRCSVLLLLTTCSVPCCLQLVAPPDQHISGTVELLALSPCRQLTRLGLLTSSRLTMPFSLKTASLATLAWPQLAALSLSCAGEERGVGLLRVCVCVCV